MALIKVLPHHDAAAFLAEDEDVELLGRFDRRQSALPDVLGDHGDIGEPPRTHRHMRSAR